MKQGNHDMDEVRRQLGEVPIICEPFQAELTLRGCLANQKAAERALALMEEEGKSFHEIARWMQSRLVGCGKCPLFLLQGADEQVEAILRATVKDLCDAMDKADLERGHPDVQKARAKDRRQRYRDKLDPEKERIRLKLRYLREKYGIEV